MKTTTKTLLTLAALASLTALAPMANAQPFHPGPMGQGRPDQGHQEMRRDEINDRIADLRGRLDQGLRTHQLRHFEFDRLSGRLNGIVGEKHRDEMSGRGLSRDETASLNAKLDRLSADVHFDRRG